MKQLTNEETERRPQYYFWQKLGQLKFDLVLYSLYFSQCVSRLRIIRIGSAVLTAATTGAWMEWHHIEWVDNTCLIAIVAFQTISAGIELLPYEKRKRKLRKLIDALEPLYNKMEWEWFRIVLGELTNNEILKKTFYYQSKRTITTRRYFGNDVIPNCKRVANKAKEESDSYLVNLGGRWESE